MVKYFIISAILFFVVRTVCHAQQTNFDETKVLYTNEWSGGGILHTNGWGATIRKSGAITGFKKRFWEIEVVNMNHPKKYKTYNSSYQDTKGFIFGKLNSLTIVRPAIGKSKTLYSKENKKGVEVNYIYSGGIAFGLVKPIYLEIINPENKITTERYNEKEHSVEKIFGKAPALKGIEETKFFPGIYSKLGLIFEYASENERIKSLETGITLDIFYKEVPMMAFIDNKQFFFSFYLSLQWGKKSY